MREKSIKPVIAELFIFSLPLRMISVFKPFTGIFGMQAESFSFLFLALGIISMVLSRKGRLKLNKDCRILSYFFKIIILFAVTSLIMSTYVYVFYGSYNGLSPYFAVFKIILDFVQYAFILIYTREVFDVLGKKRVVKLLLIGSRIPLIIGYLQIANMFSIPFFGSIYRMIADFFSFTTFQKQISLSFLEPSWAGMFIGVIVIPVHMASIINNTNKKTSCFELLLWMPVIVFTKSTTAYLLVFASFGSSIILMLFKNNKNKNSKIIAFLLLGLGLIVLNNPEILNGILGFDFSYLLQDKATDLANQSTAARTVPLIGNWEIFKHFPILGCGNGLQGYFFGEYINLELFHGTHLDSSIHVMLSGESATIPNGQLFFPGILSGYGIIGLIALIRFFVLSFGVLKKTNSIIKDIYYIAILPIMLSGFKSEFIGIIYIWFILGIPYALEKSEKGNTYGDMEKVLQEKAAFSIAND